MPPNPTCTGQVRGIARTFGEAAQQADSASGGFVRQIPPLPVTPAVGQFAGINKVTEIRNEKISLFQQRQRKNQHMTVINIVILGFILLELSNVLMLYFASGSKNANAVGVFTAWEKSKQYPEIHDLIKYLVYWVAGTKLIFLLLLTAIVIFSDTKTQRISVLALVIATSSFYWRLFPLIRKMDRNGQIEPKNYSVVLGVMIFIFIVIFLVAIIV